jgi:hypothetical protein
VYVFFMFPMNSACRTHLILISFIIAIYFFACFIRLNMGVWTLFSKSGIIDRFAGAFPLNQINFERINVRYTSKNTSLP